MKWVLVSKSKQLSKTTWFGQTNCKDYHVLSSRNVRKYQFLTGKDVLPEKDLLEKVATIERF